MLDIRCLGLLPYVQGLAEQSRCAFEVRTGRKEGVLLVVRHHPVITLGRRASKEDLHIDRWERRGLGIDLFHVERGGGATYHYPGQTIVYPILHLGRCGLTIETLTAAVGKAVVSVLDSYGVEAFWDLKRPGAYVCGAKIASIGLHVSNEITSHGVALNVGPELDGFTLIDPCKEAGLKVISMAHIIGRILNPDEIGLSLAQAIVAEIRA